MSAAVCLMDYVFVGFDRTDTSIVSFFNLVLHLCPFDPLTSLEEIKCFFWSKVVGEFAIFHVHDFFF